MQNLELDHGRKKMEKLYFGCVGSYSNTEESKQFMKEGRMFILSGLDSWHDHSFLGWYHVGFIWNVASANQMRIFVYLQFYLLR